MLFNLQCIISCPEPPDVAHVTCTDKRFPLVASLANLLDLSVRDNEVKAIATYIKSLEDKLKPLKQVTRNPLILIIDKVSRKYNI